MIQFGKVLIAGGVVLVVAGVAVIFLPRLPFIGKLPGDILIKKENFTFYFPLATSILISVILSLLLWIFRSK